MLYAKKMGVKYQVKIAPEKNENILITGTIGSGKTFATVSLIPEMVRKGYKIVILDLTGSFEDEELEKAKIGVKADRIKKIDLSDESFGIGLSMKNRNLSQCADILRNYISNSTGIDGEVQNGILQEIIERFMYFSNKNLTALNSILNGMEYEEPSLKKNIATMKSRMKVLLQNSYFKVTPGLSEVMLVDEDVLIIQLREIGNQRDIKVVASMIMNELWSLADEKSLVKCCVVLDEFQSIPLHSGDILEKIIRLGRKRELISLLATQYLTDRQPDEVAAIDMIETKLYFQPADKEIRSIAEAIDLDNVKEWRRILRGLNKGEAILKGCYFVREKKYEGPIKVFVEAEKESNSKG